RFKLSCEGRASQVGTIRGLCPQLRNETMSNGELNSVATSQSTRLAFDGHVLDLARGTLVCDGIEIDLRPKTFAVLRYLVENAGRLVAKEELFAAVWPNLAVTDDALVQSIGELRRALGEGGPRL